jgi:hypothetical protein
MDQSDELSLWLAKGWLETSGDEVQALIVEDLDEQTRRGTPLSEGVAALGRPERQAGDFGMAIAGTLLAPVLVEILKEFWSGYLKELEKETEGALAKKTVDIAKHWFLSSLKRGRNDGFLDQLERKLKELVAAKRLTEEEKVRLLNALRDDGLQQRLNERG